MLLLRQDNLGLSFGEPHCLAVSGYGLVVGGTQTTNEVALGGAPYMLCGIVSVMVYRRRIDDSETAFFKNK
jgi:hypothetical protein